MDQLIKEIKDVMHLKLTMKKLTPEQEQKHSNERQCYLCHGV